MEPLRHIPDVLQQLRNSNHLDFYHFRKNEKWHSLSVDEILHSVNCIALFLNKLGFKKGDKAGIYAKSSPFWSIVDFAIVLAGGVTVPFFPNLSEEHFLFEYRQTDPKWMFIGDSDDLESIRKFRSLFPGMATLEDKEPGTLHIDDLIRWGAEIMKESPGKIADLERAVDPEDLATIIYSSGSTGQPKGVELTHKNLVSIIHIDVFHLQPYDKYLSILPLAHIFAKQIHLISTAWGVPVYFLNDLKKIGEVCRELPITRMIIVPRVLEKAYAKMTESLNNSSWLKRTLGSWAFALAHQDDGLYKRIMHPIADKLVYRKIREAFGKNILSILSGGAPLNPYLHRFFLSIGIPILQGWGLTEGSTIAVNRLSKNKIGTVGPPIEGVAFKISELGEVLAKGPTIMKGYHQNPQATEGAIDSDGWLHTGDYGHLDEDGHLVIKGRINETFKTSLGEFVNPVHIEQKIAEYGLIDMAMIVGESLPYPSVLLFPDFENVQRLKKKHHAEKLSNEEFLKHPIVTAEIKALLERINAGLNRWEKVQEYRFILAPPTIESGELTPTMKLRRKIIHQKYQDLVQEMYNIPNGFA